MLRTPTHLTARRTFVVLVALITLSAAACSSSSGSSGGGAKSDSSSTTATKTQTTSGPVCGYYYEWKSGWKFALQPDPHAAYTYVAPKVTTDPIGYVISGPFPYAAWTSWTVYDAQAKPFSLATDSAITPDQGSANPFVVGTPVLSPKRNFTLLLVPQGTDTGTIASSLRSIPASNVITSPTSGNWFVLANRVYNAFPGYNRGGAAGPTSSPFPTVKSVNLQTGADVDCGSYNLFPHAKSPTQMPTNSDTLSPSEAVVQLADGTKLALGPQGSRRSAAGGKSAIAGAEYAPALDPDLIEFTRPPLLPGADVASIPPPDNCAGYLGAAMSTTQVGLIRMPHVAQWFDTSNLTSSTPFEQEQTTYISFTQYGSGISVYDPGSKNTGSLGNEELKPDASGGSTVLVWPTSLTPKQQAQVTAYAKQNGWAIMRGGQKGPVTTANLFVRLKGASPTYAGAYTPNANRSGVPCYYDANPTASWEQLTGDQYVASAKNIGSGAPQGVNCDVADVLSGACLESLKSYISQTGGSYTATG